MSDVTKLFDYAELALASYANLRPQEPTGSDLNIGALIDAQMTSTQARNFAQRHGNIVIQVENDPAGFSATVFKDASGNLTLAIRGSESGEINDLEADAYIAGAGAAYTQIVAMVNWWKKASSPAGQSVTQYRLARYDVGLVPEGAVVLQTEDSRVLVIEAVDSVQATGELSAALGADADGKLDVTGHSLGGHLAMAFSTLFANQVGQTVVFNAPGFIDGGSNQAFFQELGGTVPTNSSALNLTNVVADEALVGEQPFTPIAGLWSRPGQQVNISIERQWLSDEPNASSPWNHSMFVLADSLAVYKLSQDLAPALNEAQYKQIFNQAVPGTAAGYERIVDALESLFKVNDKLLEVGNGAPAREALYQAIYGLRDPAKSAYDSKIGLLQIVPTPDDAAALLAQAEMTGVQGLAYRYALKALDPFVVLGDAAASLYAAHNTNGELDAYDSATHTGTLTPQWLQDRADFLERKLYINALDTDKYYQVPSTDPENSLQPPDAQGVAYQQQARLYIDLGSGYVASSGPNPDALQNHIFGTDAADVVYAPVSGREDWLYGGGGDDVLAGYYANDYLEGGTGLDTYQFFSGDAADTVLDVDGKGLLVRNGAALDLGTKVSADVWQLGGTTYTRNGTNLEITFEDTATDKITVRDFDFAAAQAGSYLGIRLADATSLPNGASLIGDKTLVDTDSQAADVQIGYDLWGNELTEEPAVARDDVLYGSDAVGEHIEGREGNDVIFGDTEQLAAPGPRTNPMSSAVGAADFIEGGAGRDIVTAGADSYE